MPPATIHHHRPGFLIYYAHDDVSGEQGHPVAAHALRAATVIAVLALVTLLSLTLGPALRF